MRRLWMRIREAWHRFFVNPDSEQERIGQIDWYRPGGE